MRHIIVLIVLIELTMSAYGQLDWQITILAESSDLTFGPDLNNNGQVAWSQYDGHDYEVYTWVNGLYQQITNDQVNSGRVNISDNGSISWASYIPTGEEIWNYHAGNSELVKKLEPGWTLRGDLILNSSGKLAWIERGPENVGVTTSMNLFSWEESILSHIAGPQNFPEVPFVNERGNLIWRENYTQMGSAYAAEIATQQGILPNSFGHYILGYNDSQHILSYTPYQIVVLSIVIFVL